MTTIDSVYVCDIPVSREEMGFPKEGDRGNAVLLRASGRCDRQPVLHIIRQDAFMKEFASLPAMMRY